MQKSGIPCTFPGKAAHNSKAGGIWAPVPALPPELSEAAKIWFALRVHTEYPIAWLLSWLCILSELRSYRVCVSVCASLLISGSLPEAVFPLSLNYPFQFLNRRLGLGAGCSPFISKELAGQGFVPWIGLCIFCVFVLVFKIWCIFFPPFSHSTPLPPPPPLPVIRWQRDSSTTFSTNFAGADPGCGPSSHFMETSEIKMVNKCNDKQVTQKQ